MSRNTLAGNSVEPKITLDQYAKLYLSLRDDPDNVEEAADFAGVTVRIARWAHELGFPNGQPPLPALKTEPDLARLPRELQSRIAYHDDLKNAVDEAQTVTLDAKNATIEAAQTSLQNATAKLPLVDETAEQVAARVRAAQEILKDEEQTTMAHRKVSGGLARTGAEIAAGLMMYGSKVKVALLAKAQKGISEDELPEALAVMKLGTALVQQFQTLAVASMRMERLRVGAPEETLKIETELRTKKEPDLNEINPQDLMDQLSAYGRTLTPSLEAPTDAHALEAEEDVKRLVDQAQAAAKTSAKVFGGE